MRQTRAEALPYLHVENQDIEAEFDLEGNECSFPMELDELLAIGLLKLKKLQALLVERQVATLHWRTLLMGTHMRTGADSPLLKIAGMVPVLENLRGHLYGNLSKRIKQLTAGIEAILRYIHEVNQFVLSGVLDPDTIPPYSDKAQHEDDEEESHLDNQLRVASVAYESVGWAWCFKSPSRRNFLRHFLETGAVMDTSLKSYPQIRVKMDFLDMSLDSTTGLFAVMSRLRN